jgi:hypothetical protein
LNFESDWVTIILPGYEIDDQGSIPVRESDFFFSAILQTLRCKPECSVQVSVRWIFKLT